MAYAALVSLAQTIDHCLNNDQYSISNHVKRQMISIYNYAVPLQEFLEDFQNKASNLEGQMRDLANEAENKIEELMLLKWCSESSDQQQHSDHSHDLETVTHEIELIVEQVKNIKNSFKIEGEKLLEPSQLVTSSSRSPTRKDVMVGFDDDLTKTKERLCGMLSKLEVIPIFGMGGIGKTTLARNAYEDSLIMEYFHIRAWVTVSQNYSTGEVLSAILISMKVLDEDILCQESIESMAEKVYKNLKGRRYLIVVDDMWSTNVWDDLKMLFPDDNNGSRILLTTRLYDVAAYPNPLSPLHEMRISKFCIQYPHQSDSLEKVQFYYTMLGAFDGMDG